MTKEQKIGGRILEIIKEWSDDNKLISQQELIAIIDAEKNQNLPANAVRYNVQPNVSKAVNRLVDRGDVLKVGKHHYVFATEDGRKAMVKERIAQEVLFSRYDVFFASASIVMVGVSENDRKKAKELFLEYLTEKYCYDILEFEGYLVVMLKGGKTACEQSRKQIKEIVAYAKTVQVKPPKKKKLIQKKP